MRQRVIFSLGLLAGCPGPAPLADAGSPIADAGAAVPPMVWHEVVNAYAPGALLSVWSHGPSDVWIVGGERGRSIVLQFDGQRWRQHDTGMTAQSWWVHGWGDEAVMVVGEQGQAARYDGQTWTLLPTGAAGAVLYGLWGLRPDDVWAVGGPQPDAAAGVDAIEDALFHFDGSGWQRVVVGPFARPGGSPSLYKVWGSDAETVFIVGSGGLALHRGPDGFSARQTPSNNATLFTLSGRSFDEVYAVGGMGTAQMLRWDGRIWQGVDLPAQSPTSLPGVWTAPGQPIYVAGARGFTGRLDEAGWTTAWIDTAQSFHAVHFDGRRLWAVGGDIDARRADHLGAIFCSEPIPAP